MNCSNCGTYNDPQSKFCIKCGNSLTANNSNVGMPQTEQSNQNVVMQQQIQPINQNENFTQPVQPEVQYQQSLNQNNIQQPGQQSNAGVAPLNYIMYLIAILLKPIKCFKEEENKLNNPKTSFILVLIITGVMTVSNFLHTVITTVRVANYSWSEGYTYSWDFSRMKNINYLEVIGKNFLIYAGIILSIAVVFYLGSLVIKKNLNFIRTLSISATSVIPAVIGSMILSPILGLIWSPLSMVFIIIGLVYSFVILYELINSDLQLEGDIKIYFNAICFGILIVAGYYVYINLLVSSISSGLDNILDLFG